MPSSSIPAQLRPSTLIAVLGLALGGTLSTTPRPASGVTAKGAPRGENGLQHVQRVAKPKLLGELSGLAAGEGRLWAINDSGGRREIYEVALDGRLVGTWPVDIPNRDWEDLTRFQREGKWYLGVADIGDNGARRPNIRVSVFEEPAEGQQPTKLSPVKSWWLRYPEGARDAESLAFLPSSDEFIVLSKRDPIPRIYSFAWEAGEVSDLRFRAELPGWREAMRNLLGEARDRGSADWRVTQPTAISIRPSDERLVLVTYTEVIELDLPKVLKGGASTELQGVYVDRQRHGLPQAEAVAYSPEGDRIWLGSERKSSLIVVSAAKKTAAARAPASVQQFLGCW